MSKKNRIIMVQGENITITKDDYISLTDMLKAKDGDFFISDWLRNRNTVEYLGIWERIHNPDFNCGEFAIIKSKAGLHSYKISVKEWVAKTNSIGLTAKAGRYGGTYAHKDIAFEFLNVALFGKTAAQWREENPDEIGNIRDFANVLQLVCLANMENLNAVFINEGLEQAERLTRLNRIAIGQMRILVEDRATRKLEGMKA